MPLFINAPRRISLDLTPAEIAARAQTLPGMVFFDTSLEGHEGVQLSLIAAVPTDIIRGKSAADWARLRAEIAARQMDAAPDDGLPSGIAAGYVEYDGTFAFGFYENVLIYRHANHSWHEVGDLWSRIANLAPASDVAGERLEFVPEMTRERYCAMIAKAQEFIAAGDIYQVNLAHRFTAPWRGEAFAFYEALRHYSPAPHGAYLALDGRKILSASPELFLKMSGQAIRTRPIKGTRPRRAEPHADTLSAYELRTSPKEAAELVMITDLERNDLGQVCEYGSVAVNELLKLESFEQVFHLVSTVEGRLRNGIDHTTALRACFPGGSITGAPKKRAREIIAALEPTPRGVYTGALGWFGFNGESQFSIAIRTVVVEEDRAHFHVGAGIVADSVAEKEWQETLDKAAGILLAAERFDAGPG